MWITCPNCTHEFKRNGPREITCPVCLESIGIPPAELSESDEKAIDAKKRRAGGTYSFSEKEEHAAEATTKKRRKGKEVLEKATDRGRERDEQGDEKKEEGEHEYEDKAEFEQQGEYDEDDFGGPWIYGHDPFAPTNDVPPMRAFPVCTTNSVNCVASEQPATGHKPLQGMLIVEVGGGTGSLAKHLILGNPRLRSVFAATDFMALEGDTLLKARESAINCMGGVDATKLVNFVNEESVHLIISANCYHYGLTKGSPDRNHAWDFLDAAARVLATRGSLVMVLRSNILFYYFKSINDEESLKALRFHNKASVGVFDRLLTTQNGFGPTNLKHLNTIADRYKFRITFCEVVPPADVDTTAHADKRAEDRGTALAGFNVQIIFTKMPNDWQVVAASYRHSPAYWTPDGLRQLVPHLMDTDRGSDIADDPVGANADESSSG